MVAAVAVAVVAVVAAAVDAVAASASVAAPLGVRAAGAKRGHSPRVIARKVMAGLDTVDPAYSFLPLDVAALVLI